MGQTCKALGTYLRRPQFRLFLLSVVLSGFEHGIVAGAMYKVTLNSLDIDSKSSKEGHKKIALTMIIFWYSAMKNRANFMPEYSV